EPGHGRAQLRRRRCDAAAVGPPGDVRLLPRHRLLPGPGRRAAPLAGGRCLCACQPGGHGAAAELRPELVAVAGRRRIAGGGPGRLRGLADAHGRGGGYRWPWVADEQDRAAVVPAATDLERHGPNLRCQASARRSLRPRTRAELRALSWRISIHVLEYSLTLSLGILQIKK